MGRSMPVIIALVSLFCLMGASRLRGDDCNASTADVPCLISCHNGCMAMVMAGKCYKQCSSHTKDGKAVDGVELKRIKAEKNAKVNVVMSDFPYSDLDAIFGLSREFEIKPAKRDKEIRLTLKVSGKTFEQVAKIIKEEVEKGE